MQSKTIMINNKRYLFLYNSMVMHEEKLDAYVAQYLQGNARAMEKLKFLCDLIMANDKIIKMSSFITHDDNMQEFQQDIAEAIFKLNRNMK